MDVPKIYMLDMKFCNQAYNFSNEPRPIYLINAIIMEIDKTKSLYSVIADVHEFANELLLMYFNPSRNYIYLLLY